MNSITVGSSLMLHGCPLLVRPLAPGDMAYVLATWLRSELAALPARRRPERVPHLRLEATTSLERHGAAVVCSEEHPTTIHAWACAEPASSRLSYAYVPFDLRGAGLGHVAIEAALRSYPERITVRHWPWPSTRFIRETPDRKAA